MSENVYIVIDQMQTLLDEARAQRDRAVAALRDALSGLEGIPAKRGYEVQALEIRISLRAALAELGAKP